MMESILAENRTVLTAIESKAVLKAFGIPVTTCIAANTKEKALAAAKSLGFPVVVKINSPDISHKQDVGGIRLNLVNKQEVSQAFDDLLKQVKKLCPQASIWGVTVEPMIKNPNNRELLIGVAHDKVFGPVISFGAGGTLVEIMKDRALALPPLNYLIAKRLIEKTRIAKLLGAFRHMLPVDLNQIIDIMLDVSEMVCELPYIQEMDINPLIINENGAIVVDARIVIASQPSSFIPYSHLAIHPYPSHLISSCKLTGDIPIIIRPIRPEDAEIEQEFVQKLSPESKYFRFMEHLNKLTPEMLVRFTQIDYDREMVFIAIYEKNIKEMAIGISRYIINPDEKSCEFTLVVADAWKNKGLGYQLLARLIETAKIKGLKEMVGFVLANNFSMLNLVESMGFFISNDEDEAVKIVTKKISTESE